MQELQKSNAEPRIARGQNASGWQSCRLLVLLLILLASCRGAGSESLDASPDSVAILVSQPSVMDLLPPASADEAMQARMEFARLETPAGMDEADWQELGDALLEAMESRSASKLPDEGRNEIDDLTWVDNGGGDFNLEWTFRNAGDYDNNGEVNVSDLSSIGVHFGKNESSSDWDTAQTADGDGNGEINIADVSPIGINFGSQVLGYRVYASDYEDGPWLLQGEIALQDASTDYPRTFDYSYGAQQHAFVTVSPFDATDNDLVAMSGGTAAKYIPGETEEIASQIIDESGGQLIGTGVLEGITVDIPAGALDRTETITLGSNNGSVLPAVGTWGGVIIDISGDDQILFEEPIVITAPFSGDPDAVPCPYYIREDGKFEACMLTDLDRDNGTFSFATEHTSEYAHIEAIPLDLITDYKAPVFSPKTFGFQIYNWGSQYNPIGECWGMTSFAEWYFRFASPKTDFFPRFMNVLDFDHLGHELYGQNIIATRSFNSMAEAQQRWITNRPDQVKIKDQLILIKHAIRTTSDPTHVGLSEDNYAKSHAVLAYGYTDDQLLIYDPDFPGELPFIDIEDDSFSYIVGPNWTKIFHLGIGTVVRENFGDILADAEAGFSGSKDAFIGGLNYANDDVVTENEITLTGNISSSELLIERLKIHTGTSTHETDVHSLNGSFSVKLPILNGDNYFFFRTEGRDGANNWVEAHNNFAFNRGLYLVGDYEPEKLRITLTWDRNNAFGMFVKDPSGEWIKGERFDNWNMSLKTDAGGYFVGSYESGGPLHFIIPENGTLAPGPYQFQVINSSTVEEYGVVPANWELTVSFNEGPPQLFNGFLSEGYADNFPPAFGDPEDNPFLSPAFTINYEEIPSS